MNTWSVIAANIIRSAVPSPSPSSPGGRHTAVASTRSAASLERVSTKRRYQPARRSAGMSAPRRRSTGNRGGPGAPLCVLMDADRLSSIILWALRPAVEEGVLTLVGATTENPFFEANAPLISRSMVFRVEPLGEANLTTIVERALVPAGPPAHFADVPRS
jgi:hypothetical protein